MAPPPPPPPALMDDTIGEILLRLPPADPACLVRASLVCKPWLRLLCDRAFLRRYRAFHRTPPMLGFFNQYLDFVPSFVHTTQASLPVPQPAPAGQTLDCRHGRVLLHPWNTSRLTVWDPITGDQQSFSSPVDPNYCFAAAVLCASHGCDHLQCSGGPFLVVIAGMVRDNHGGNGVALCSIYTSETHTWSVPTSFDLTCFIDRMTPSLLAGDSLFFTVQFGVAILKYDLVGGVPSVISMPPIHQQDMCLITAEDGGLGVAAVEDCSLHLWSWRTNPDGVGEWVQGKVIELDAMISVSIGAPLASVSIGPLLASVSIGVPLTSASIIGFAECTDTVFITTNNSANDAIFGVELKSGRTSEICKKKCVLSAIFPFTSFYIPGLASASLQGSVRD